jgi:hypothetical protein
MRSTLLVLMLQAPARISTSLSTSVFVSAACRLYLTTVCSIYGVSPGHNTATAIATAHKLSSWQVLEDLCKQVIHIELQDLCYIGQLLNMFVSFSFENRKFPLLMPRSQSQSPKRLGHFKLGEFRAEYFACKLGPLAKSPQASSGDAAHGDASYPFGSAVNE